MDVLIAGGGIGGLTAAIACQYFGHNVTVFERAESFTDVGAGLQLSPNAIRVLYALGVKDLQLENAVKPQAIEARLGRSGRQIFSVPVMTQTEPCWGAAYYHIHRSDLIQLLAERVVAGPAISVELGQRITGFDQSENEVSITLSNGRVVHGDILIGADGIHSVVRQGLFGQDKPEFTGNRAWRLTVPASQLKGQKPNPTACVWMGAGRHAVTYWLCGGEFVNFVGVVECQDWLEESWTKRGRRKEALCDFQDWHPIITDIIRYAAEDSFYSWGLYDRAPMAEWSKGYVTLLGDAAHAMLPFMAQGAAMAIEDAWSLARAISHEGRQIEQSLKAYEAQRIPRTRRVQNQSRANMKTFHKTGGFSQLITYGPMWLAGKLWPAAIQSRFDWLYEYDVTRG